MANIMKLFSKDYIREKWNHSGFQRYFKNTAWMLGSRILSMVVSFIATLYIARNLGPTNYGQLSYAVSFISLFGFVASLGLDGILYRDLIKFPEKKATFMGTSFWLKMTAGAVTGIACILFSLYFAQDDVSKILIFILATTFILNPIQVIAFDFQSRAESKYPSIIAFFIGLILNAVKILIIASGKGVIYLALSLVLEPLLYAIAYIFIYEKKTESAIRSWEFSGDCALSLLRDSFPLMILSAFSLVYARIDQVLIKHMMNATAVGLYDSAVRIAEVWSFIPGIIVSAVYPAIVNAKIASEQLYEKRLGRLALLLFVLAVGIALPVSVFASYIIHMLYGNAFLDGIIVLKIYVWANVGTFLGMLASQYLITENLRRELSFIAFVPMIFNISLNLLWIPVYGIEGAAYATLVSYSLAPLSLLLFRRTRHKVINVYNSLFS